MIKKININRFGLFNNYTWDASIGSSNSFKRLNIIYGRNYSGKTTLSRIFRCLEKGELHPDYKDSDFNVTMYDQTVINSSTLSTSVLSPKIRVYNTDFVTENLSWVRNPEGSIKPFTILGSKNVEIESKINEIESKLGNSEERKGLRFELEEKTNAYNQKNSECKAKLDALNLLLKNKANNEIKTNPDYFIISQSKKTYQTNDIESEIEKIINSNINSYILSSEQIDQFRKQLKEEPKAELAILPLHKPEFQEYRKQAESLLKAPIKPTQSITDLINDSLLQEWVRQGIEKHKGKRDTCAFCGNSLADALWDKLDAHFSKESEELRIQINKLIKSLTSIRDNIGSFINFTRDHFYFSFQTQFDELYSNWQLEIKQHCNNLNILINELSEREKNIFQARPLGEILDNTNTLFKIITQVNQLIEENNRKAQTLKSDQASARNKLRHSVIANFINQIDYLNRKNELFILENSVKTLNEEKSRISRNISTLQDEKVMLEAQAKDESKGAALVNRYLLHYFGHNDFQLVAEGQTPVKFKIKRGDEDAQNLSEGECSLISFCYFIARLEDEMKDPQNVNSLVIYIDDPISSLDNNHVFFMYSLIEAVIAKPAKYCQLFISTHNLDFLNYLKRLTVPKYSNAPQDKPKDSISHFLVERKSKTKNNLCLVPEYFKKYVTEFNYLFGQIHQCSISDDLTVANSYQYSFSNNMRKFLEGYLYYKYPSHNLNLDKRLHKFFDNDTITVNLINRVVNEYSHLEDNFDRSIYPIDIDIIKSIAKAVICKIKEKDHDQYLSLCESLGIAN